MALAPSRRRRAAATALTAGLLAVLTPVAWPSASAAPIEPATPAARDTEPVVLTGTAFPGWAAPAEVTAKVPSVAGAQCTSGDNDCSHNQYEEPEAATGDSLGTGAPVERILGYRWDKQAQRFRQIPLQVDELAVRYLSNNASTFSVYSQTDPHPTYVWDEERFRWTDSAPGQPCLAAPVGGQTTTPDPVPGLDTDDEVVFMATDAGPLAPANAWLPPGVIGSHRVAVYDPYAPNQLRYVYVMLAGPNGPQPEFTASNGYVRYEPDADADTFVYSQSSYGSYGNAAKGAWYDPATDRCVTDEPRQRRPKDTAWVRTSRYAFRYDGRWLMTQLKVVPPNAAGVVRRDASTWTHGPDLIDQWKARAFQQRPSGEMPCCGYEEEVNNWGGSSILLGWRAGPVRVIRSTWGSDSATNNVRTEIFYRDEIRQQNSLRVHPIPPGDGIYVQWDYNAGKIDRYYNPYIADTGAPVDGQDDEVLGNARVHAGRDGVAVEDVVDGQPPVELSPDQDGVGEGDCGGDPCAANDVDVTDPTHSGPTSALSYEQVTGPFGTIVSRWSVRQPVNGGAGYSVAAMPYYRDDSCFDDGTGTDPGVRVNPRAVDPEVDSAGVARECWKPEHGDPSLVLPRDHFWQGSIGTHGLHLHVIVDSDNAFTTLPLTEILSEQRLVMLPGRQPNVGERYGRGTEKPLVAAATPESRTPAPAR